MQKSFLITFGEPLKGDNVTAIIIDSIKLIMPPFCHSPIPKWLPSSADLENLTAPFVSQTPFPEVRKLTNKTPAAIASSKPLPVT